VTLIRPIALGDVQLLAALAEDMDRFYGAGKTEPLEIRLQQIREALFGDMPAAYTLLALDDEEAVGFAAYSFLWPAVGLTRSLYLKELFVTPTRHRTGVGRQLMESLFETARKHGCSRVEWTADQDNPGAQAFYKEIGAEPLGTKLFYRLVEGTHPESSFPS
jgi:GNAT superfamily N-acetyltransferase